MWHMWYFGCLSDFILQSTWSFINQVDSKIPCRSVTAQALSTLESLCPSDRKPTCLGKMYPTCQVKGWINSCSIKKIDRTLSTPVKITGTSSIETFFHVTSHMRLGPSLRHLLKQLLPESFALKNFAALHLPRANHQFQDLAIMWAIAKSYQPNMISNKSQKCMGSSTNSIQFEDFNLARQHWR